MSTLIAATLLQRPPLFLCVVEDPESLFRTILSVSEQDVYCVPPPPAAETPTTICVPPSSWISCFAPSRMLEACAILGSCCPGALFASSTPGTDVVAMAMLPVLATTVPAAGPPLAAGAAPVSPPVACGAALALPPALLPPLPPALGLEEPPAGGPLAGPEPPDAEPDAGAID
jgi:hypothetical protein